MLSCTQAYKYWLQGQHPFLFIVNNDVLVPSGVLTRLMAGMRDDGASASRLLIGFDWRQAAFREKHGSQESRWQCATPICPSRAASSPAFPASEAYRMFGQGFHQSQTRP